MNAQSLIDDILENHHKPLRTSLPQLEEALSAVPSLQKVLQELMWTMNDHMMKEEAILFPSISALARGEGGSGCGVLGPIQQMRHEHTEIRALEATLRQRSGEAGAAEPALLAMLDDLAIHADKEDTQLFPAALELAGLPEPEWEDEEEEVLPPPPPPVRRSATGKAGLLRRIRRRIHGGRETP